MLTDEEELIHVVEQAQIEVKGNVVENFEDFIEFINRSDLSEGGKVVACGGIARQRDVQNLLRTEKAKVIYECPVCHYYGRTVITCEKCVRDYLEEQFDKWTSGNKELDKEIQKTQQKIPYPVLLIEWIPIKELTNIEPLDRGAFSQVFSATWTKGIACDFLENQLVRERNSEVSLKQLPEDIGYKEIETHFKAKRNGFGVIPCYGITRNENGYMLVLMRMRQNLENYLKENRPLSRHQIYNLLWTFSSRLYDLHKVDIIHKDLHPGNFMIDEHGIWNLIDLGVSGLARNETRKFYGNIINAAPELTQGDRPHSKESDIYALAMIMCEVETDAQPKFDSSGRPILATILPTDFPEDYRQIMERCLDLEPTKRPSSEDLVKFFYSRM